MIKPHTLLINIFILCTTLQQYSGQAKLLINSINNYNQTGKENQVILTANNHGKTLLLRKTEIMLTIDLMAFYVIYLTLNGNKINMLMYYNHDNSIANL